jgi:hypothetical protein
MASIKETKRAKVEMGTEERDEATQISRCTRLAHSVLGGHAEDPNSIQKVGTFPTTTFPTSGMLSPSVFL